MRKTLLTLLAIAGCATASGSGGGPVPADMPANQTPGPGPQPASAPDLLYVCNQSDATVTLIDTRTNTIVGLVDLTTLGFSKNAKPHHIAVEPDGGGDRVAVRSVHHDDAADRCRGHVDIVHADSRATDHAQARRFVEQFGGYFGFTAND